MTLCLSRLSPLFTRCRRPLKLRLSIPLSSRGLSDHGFASRQVQFPPRPLALSRFCRRTCNSCFSTETSVASPIPIAPSPLRPGGSTSSVGRVVLVQADLLFVKGLDTASVGSLVWCKPHRVLSLSSDVTAALRPLTPEPGLVMVMEAGRVVVALISSSLSVTSYSLDSIVTHRAGEWPTFPLSEALMGRVLTCMAQPYDQNLLLAHPSHAKASSIHVRPRTSHAPETSLYESALEAPCPASAVGVVDSNTLSDLFSCFPGQRITTVAPPFPLTQQASPSDFLSTGYKHIDSFHPILKGLRVGLSGLKHTGKTFLATEILAHVCQGSDNMFGVYVSVGKSRKEVQRVRDRLHAAGVLNKCTIIYASDMSSSGAKYLTPFSGCTIADWHRENGRDCLIVYDDLVTHGSVCMGMDTTIGYPSMSTPYLHASLLDRTAAMRQGGSSTALCILENFHPESAMSVIDGLTGVLDHCVLFNSDLASARLWPSISTTSIIGRRSARYRPSQLRHLTNAISQMFLQSEQTANQRAWAREFRIESDIEDEEDIIAYRDKLQILLSQSSPMDLANQIITLTAANTLLLAPIHHNKLPLFEAALHQHIRVAHTSLYENLSTAVRSTQPSFSPSLMAQLQHHIEAFMRSWSTNLKRANGY